MEHTHVRSLISAGESSPDAEAHLKTCAACRGFADRLGTVRTMAPTVAVTDVPDGLADRVVATVRARVADGTIPAGGAAVVSLPWWRRVGGRVAVAATVAAAVAAGAMTVSRSGPAEQAPRERLVAAAKNTQAATAIRFTMTGKAEYRLAIPLPAPDFSGMIGRIFDSIADGQAPVVKPEMKSITRMGSRLEASGVGLLPDRWHLKGTVTPDFDGIFGETGSHPVESITIEDSTWVRIGERQWMKLPRAAVVVETDPGALLEMAAAPPADVDDLGDERLDGEIVHHYRFSRSQAGPTVTYDLWVDGSGLVRRIAFAFEHDLLAAGSMTAEAEVRITPTDDPISIEPPPADEVVDYSDAIGVWAGVGAFRLEIAMPRFTVTPPPVPTYRPSPPSMPPMPRFDPPPMWTPPADSWQPPPDGWSPEPDES